MSFGLKNAGAMYQRDIQHCLADEIKDDLVEAYVDDVVVKTREAHTLVDNLQHTFTAPNKYQWKLNPKKCIFGVPSGVLLATSSATMAYAQPDKGKGCFRYAATQKHQGCPEAHWMHGRLKSFYLTTRRKGLAFFQVTQGFRKICLVGRS
jgi:hypothetical protein